MSTMKMPTIPDKYADSVLAKFLQYYDQILSHPDRVETTTRGWDAASIRRSLIEIVLDAYEEISDVSKDPEKPDPEDVDSYIQFILEEGHTKLSRKDRLDMFLSNAMERPWVVRKEDGTPKRTCDMCMKFSREDTTWVDPPSYSAHWLDCPEDSTCSFQSSRVNRRYSTEQRTRIARYHTSGGWRSYPKDKFDILKSTLVGKEEEEQIAPGLPRHFFNEPWCAQQTHASHVELEGEVTDRGRGLRYFNILKSGGLSQPLWRVTDSQVLASIKQVETGQIASLFESIPDAWRSVSGYEQVPAMAVLKIEEEMTRRRALDDSAHCRSVRSDKEEKDKNKHIWSKADCTSDRAYRAPIDQALAAALRKGAPFAQTSASAGGAEEGSA